MLALSLVVGFFFFFSNSRANVVIEDVPVTDWGTWGSWAKCPLGTYATAFQLKVSNDQLQGDDVGLDGICLYCNCLGLPFNESNWITSTSSPFGSWRDIFLLDGFMTGYQLRAEPKLGHGLTPDDTAANNLRVFAASANLDKRRVEGDGLYFGQWLPEQHCRTRQAVCGLRTQVEPDLGSAKDNTALNNVKFECCDLPNPAESCTPKDKWELVGVCDNSRGTQDLLCTYDVSYGISYVSTCSQKAYEATVLEMVGFTTEYTAPYLSLNYRTHLPESKATGFKWALETNPPTWSRQTIHRSQYYTKPGLVSKLYQNVGYCGYFVVRSSGISITDFRGHE